jgi:hypothetical protein
VRWHRIVAHLPRPNTEISQHAFEKTGNKRLLDKKRWRPSLSMRDFEYPLRPTEHAGALLKIPISPLIRARP